MKVKKQTAIGILVIAILLAIGVGIYFRVQSNGRNSLASRIAELGGKGGPPETIEGLRKAIALYEDQIERHVKDAAQTGVYWKILAVRLQDKGFHNQALEALDRAIYYNSGDATLQYLAGLSASLVAKSSLDFSGGNPGEGARYYALAEAAYLNSVSLDADYGKPRYGLGVLYIFELNRPADAIPHMIRYLEINPKDTDGMFILARAYYVTGLYDEALNLYDRIIDIAKKNKNTEKQAEAERNRRQVVNDYYG